MLCLKEKCDYCVEHEFRMSYYTCLLSSNNMSFGKDSDVMCVVGNKIEEAENDLVKLTALKERLIERGRK